MVYAIHLMVGLRNVARRDGVMTSVQQKWTQTSMWGAPVVVTIDYPVASPRYPFAPSPGFSMLARYVAATDRDADMAGLDALLGTGANGPVVGSVVWTHDCVQDEGLSDCVLGASRTW